MAQRGVSAEQVEETLEAPDELLEGDEGELIAVREGLAYVIKVAYGEIDHGVLLIYTVIKSRIRHHGNRSRR